MSRQLLKKKNKYLASHGSECLQSQHLEGRGRNIVSLMPAYTTSPCLGKSMSKTGALSLLIKCLLYKHWGLKMGSQHPCKSGVWWHMPLTPVLTARQVAAEPHGSSSILSTTRFRFFGEILSENQKGGEGGRGRHPKVSLWPPHVNTRTNASAHTCAHTCPHTRCLNS